MATRHSTSVDVVADTDPTASQFNTLRYDTATAPIHIVKEATETVTNSTTLQDDDELQFTMEASATYAFHFCLTVEGNTATDFSWGVTSTGATAIGYTVQFLQGDGASGYTGFFPGYASGGVIITGGTLHTLHIFGYVTASSGSSKTVKVRWAQGTPVVNTLRVLKGSYVTAQRVS